METLLIVDDMEVNRQIVRKIVGETYDLVEAANGQEAIEVLKQVRVDIVVTDIFMEPMNGYELIAWLRAQADYQRIPIIAITESDRASRTKALKAGADDLLYRPLVSDILIRRVQGLLSDGFGLDQYRNSYENNPISFFLFHVIDRPDTPSCKLLYWNARARQFFGQEYQEGNTYTDEKPILLKLLTETLRTGTVSQVSFKYEPLNCWLSVTTFLDGTNRVGVMAKDITDAVTKETESVNHQREELKLILNQIPSGVIVCCMKEDDAEVVAVNQAIIKTSGLPESEILGRRKEGILSLIHPEDRERCWKEMSKLSQPDQEIRIEYRTYSAPDYTPVYASGHSIRKEDGNVYAFFAYVDLTSQIRLQEARIQLEEATKANREKTLFLSRLSHDVRTPLNGILGMSELMRDTKDPAAIEEGINQIQLSGQYLLSLMNDALDLSKIEQGKLNLHEKPTNSFEVMQNILRNAQMLASAKDIQLQVVLPPIEMDQWIPVYMDASRIEQILLNVLSNAVKYTPEHGKVTVHMETVSITDEEVVDRYCIEDNGIGIAKEFMPHLYEPFKQEGRMGTTTANGTGLGLSIVKQLMDLMHSTIEIESEVNVGTKVILTMHYRRYHGTPVTTPKKPVSIEQLRGMKVLLVEDHPLNAEITIRLLEKVGVEVDLASDGKIGLDLFESSAIGQYEAILMDLRMPVMDGLEATRKIRSLARRDATYVPIIAMTANAYEEDIEACRNAGMDAHLSKPVHPEVLYQTLAENAKPKML